MQRVDPAGGLAKVAAGLFGLALQQPDLTRGRFGLRVGQSAGGLRGSPTPHSRRQRAVSSVGLVPWCTRYSATSEADAARADEGDAGADRRALQDLQIAEDVGAGRSGNARVARGDAGWQG